MPTQEFRAIELLIADEIRELNVQLCEDMDYDSAQALNEAIHSHCRVLVQAAERMEQRVKCEVWQRLQGVLMVKPRRHIAGGPGLPYNRIREVIKLLQLPKES